MIRGHIDSASRTEVVGWIHAEHVPLAGMTVLAFIDQRQVGAGEVGLFREDLLNAGIGDGHGGFRFPIQLEPTQDPRRLDIRLEGSNALIRQSHACLMAREDTVATPRAPRDAASLAWMRARGWLTPEQHDVLHRLGSFGVYRQRLDVLAIRGGQDERVRDARAWTGGLRDAAAQDGREEMAALAGEFVALAGEFLELHMQMSVTARIHAEVWEEDLAALQSHLRSEFPATAPVIGLWAPWTNCVNVSEGSHWAPRRLEPITGVDYEFGKEHLLWLNLDTNFHVPTGGFASPAVAFVPARVEA